MIRVIPGVSDSHVPEDTAISPQDVVRPRPTPQFGSLYGGGTATGRDDEGPHKVHCGEETDTADATKATHEGGHALRRSATGRVKTALTGTAQERVDLQRDLETSG